jgi:hypothetical protein
VLALHMVALADVRLVVEQLHRRQLKQRTSP